MNTNIRSATKMEKAKQRAVALSALLVVVMLTAAIAFIALATNNKGNNPGNPMLPTDEVSAPIAFTLPISGSYTILKEYSDTELQYNETARRWEGHKAYSLSAAEGTNVVATYAGTVSSVVTNAMYGTMVTIQHKDGLQTVYSGLDKTVSVSTGDQIEKGQKIGAVGTTAANEFVDTPHIRLEVYKNGKKINPADYISFANK